MTKLPCFVRFGDQIEDFKKLDNDESYFVLSRNFLRYLTYDKSLPSHHLFNKKILLALFIKPNLRLLKAIREEMQHIFLNIWAFIQTQSPYDKLNLRLSIFINTFLSDFSFLKPQENETLSIPVFYNDCWELLSYQINKIDISPKNGLIGRILKERNFLYAYGLEPYENKSPSLLLFMGTSYPGDESASLTYLYNFYPGKSVGEKHNLEKVHAWLSHHQNTIVLGHSLGGTMAMIAAIKFSPFIRKVVAFNPTALHKNTLKNSGINKDSHPKATIEVFTQKNDPVFFIDNTLLKGTSLYVIGAQRKNENIFTRGFESHIKNFSGFAECDIVKIENNLEYMKSRKRHLFNYLKSVLNFIIYPVCYISIVLKNIC